jgi:DNA polymerase-1
MQTSSGEPTSALYGFCSLLLKILREENPIGLAFAVDAPEKTFRHARYEAYKATRAAASDELRLQLVRLGQVWDCLAVPVFRVPGFEADDILATVARKLRDEGAPTLIVSGDRDLLQLAHGSVRVLFTGVRGKDAVLYDAERVKERFGISAQELPFWSALVGDPSDNLPGVRGVGPRTAAALVATFHDARTLVERMADVVPERVRRAVEESHAQILLNEELSRLRDDVPLPEGPLALPPTLVAIDRWRSLFRELEFKSLLARLPTIEEQLGSHSG